MQGKMDPIPLFFQLLGWTSWQTSVNTAAKSTLIRAVVNAIYAIV